MYKTFGSGIHLLRLAMRETASSGGMLSSQTSLFEPLITDLAMRGGDADTNACFASALVGAYLGYKALPAHWRDGLQHGAWLMRKAEGLCQLLGVVDGDYRGSRDAETAADMERKVMLLQAWMAEEGQQWKRREEEERKKRKNGGWLKWR